MRDRLIAAKVVAYPVVNVTFEDGLTGDVDFASDIEKFPMFSPLRDKTLFEKVAIDHGGFRLGWNLDDAGNEIDFGSDQIRTQVETAFIVNLARKKRAQTQAAE